jgi:uncharacterized protein (TIGR02246 family)
MPVTALQSPGEAAAADIRKFLPVGWTCTVVSEKGQMGHPHGLEEPLFRLDFVNANQTFSVDDGPGQTRVVHPNLRLHFHSSSERERILKTIEAERVYSWAIPVLFADTRNYVVVTSPLWQNHYSTRVGDTNWGAGVYTDEANRLIAPLLGALKAYFTASTPAQNATSQSQEARPEVVVQRFVDAGNARNANAMAALVAVDAVFARFPGGQVIAQSRDGIREYYSRQLQSLPADVRVTVQPRIVEGQFVIDQEHFAVVPGERRQATWMYLVRDGLIYRAWVLDGQPGS